MNKVHHADRAALAAAVVGVVADAIDAAVAARGRALVALAGGSTPAAMLPALFARALPWASVVLCPSDERVVEEGDKLSNIGALRSVRRGTPAAAAGLLALDAAGAASTKLARLVPFDLVWAGMGADGHVLSWFPGPDLAAAYESAALAVAVNPDPLPVEAPVTRVTLSRAAMAGARAVLLVATGADKLARIDAPEGLPVGVLMAASPSLQIHWAP